MTKIFNKQEFLRPLDQCSKLEDESGISEYDTMIAIVRMNDIFSEDELRTELKQVIVNKTLSNLIDKGLVKAVWDDKQEEFVFYPVEQ